MITEEPKILLTPEEAAKRLRIKERRVHGLVREGKLGCVQVSPRERLFTADQLQEFIESRTVAVPRKMVDKSTAKNYP